MPKLNLKTLTSSLFEEFLPTAVSHRNLLINDVPDSLCADKDHALAKPVISGMIKSILSDAENKCIRLSARIFEGIIFLNITDGKGINYCGVIEGYQERVPVVISFNFPNLAA
jgi:hypothetical protein